MKELVFIQNKTGSMNIYWHIKNLSLQLKHSLVKLPIAFNHFNREQHPDQFAIGTDKLWTLGIFATRVPTQIALSQITFIKHTHYGELQ